MIRPALVLELFRWWEDAQLYATRRAERTGRRHRVTRIPGPGRRGWIVAEVEYPARRTATVAAELAREVLP